MGIRVSDPTRRYRGHAALVTDDPLDRLDEHFDILGVYDMEGNRISFREWMDIRSQGPEAIRVARTEIGDAYVSTVHLGLDHSYGFGGPPLIFETMIFGGNLDGEQWRYSTKEEALEGHERAVELVRLEVAVQ